MPPKRRGGATAGRGGKRAKKAVKAAEPEPEPCTSNPIKDSMAKLKRGNTIKKKAKADANCPLASASVYNDYDCMLNQTNIGHNNNKYYIIQVLEMAGKYYAWNRWGRVGETGQNSLKGPMNVEGAIKDFEKKFRDKTKNKWEDRANFNPSPGKYTLIEVESTEVEDMAEASAKLAELDDTDSTPRKFAPSSLPKPTQSLVNLIFDNDMFKEAMANFEIDVKKMPLGKLSKAQIAKGFDVLVDLENAIKGKKNAQLDKLTSQFYTLIPHDFGRQRPPIINTEEKVRNKKDMLLVLADIELAQSMQKDEAKKKGKGKGDAEELAPDPLDSQYDMLNCDLEVVDKKSKEFKIIKTYLDKTKSSKLEILDVWKVNRQGEDERFKEHDKLGNRKLLWHGTNVAVVAAILKSGLRIMPHSGGRVGRGIYFASENAKSAGYVRCARNTGIMFLNEVVLGKEHHITRDDWNLVAPPKGYDSIIAKGRTEPDAKHDTALTIDGKEVIVPQGSAVNTKQTDSNFWQSEYLIYKESQNRIRYLLKLKF